MDPARGTISTLRQRVATYLEHLMPLLAIQCVVTTYVDWQDQFNTRHTYEVKLRHFNPTPDDPFLAWEIVIKPWGSMQHRVQLGLLEIERALYDHPGLVHFNGPFVLDGLKRSVVSGTPIRHRNAKRACRVAKTITVFG
ncbi:hypothetical protein APHAL10511_000784 [Amanita phalloides]|nr:hypothetical protein APHAL10511_000784 [Amanita phalloides]